MLNIEVGGAGGGYAFKVDDGGGGVNYKKAPDSGWRLGGILTPPPPHMN